MVPQLEGRYVSQEIFNDWVQSSLEFLRANTEHPRFHEFVARGIQHGEYKVAGRYGGRRVHVVKSERSADTALPGSGHVACLEAALNFAEQALARLSEKDWGYSDPAEEARVRAQEAASYLAHVRSIRAGGDGDK